MATLVASEDIIRENERELAGAAACVFTTVASVSLHAD
jgi:hypothetical protein